MNVREHRFVKRCFSYFLCERSALYMLATRHVNEVLFLSYYLILSYLINKYINEIVLSSL